MNDYDTTENDDGEAEGGLHSELRGLLDAGSLPPAMVAHAEVLLALPEESVAALVTAAQSMVEAASFGRGLGGTAYVTDEDGSNPRSLYGGEPLDL